jgi:hypothetical protein
MVISKLENWCRVLLGSATLPLQTPAHDATVTDVFFARIQIKYLKSTVGKTVVGEVLLY